MGTFVNIAILVVLLFFVISGVRRGLVRSLVELIGCILSIALAVAFSPKLALAVQPYLTKWAPSWSSNLTLDRIAAAVVLFVLCSALVQVIARAMDQLFHLPGLKQINSLLGGVFGLCKGAAVLLMVFAFLQLFVPAQKLWQSDPLLQKFSGSAVFRYAYTHNPVTSLLEKDFWNGVNLNDKQKQEL